MMASPTALCSAESSESQSGATSEQPGVTVGIDRDRRSRRKPHRYLLPASQEASNVEFVSSTAYSASELWCVRCSRSFPLPDLCPKHSTLFVNDASPLSRARSSLPAVLKLQSMAGTEGVFTRRPVTSQTVFGPFVAPIGEQLQSGMPLPLETENGMCYLCFGDEEQCNWMMFVRMADNYEEMNVSAFQFCDSIFFAVCREIPAQKELRVGYAPHYAERFGLVTLRPSNRPVLECFECGLELASQEDFDEHMQSHEEHEPIPARPARQRTQKYLKRVLKRSQRLLTRSYHRCPCCPLTFATREMVEAHRSLHNDSSSAVAGHCRSCGQDVANLALHVSEVHGRRRCPDCYKLVRDLEEHAATHSGQKPLECDVCKARFVNNSALACHKKTHSQDKYFQCPVCKHRFDKLAQVKTHLRESHADTEGLTACPHCPGRRFVSYASLWRHVRNSHTDDQLPCPECGKLFPRSDKLRLHLLSHSDVRQFMCHLCGKRFKRKDKMKEHLRKLHGPQDSPPPASRPLPQVPPDHLDRFIYRCQECQVGFKRRGMLVNHLVRRHPGTSPDSLPELSAPILRPCRVFLCPLCDKRYLTSSKRKAHMQRNHPDAPSTVSTAATVLDRGCVAEPHAQCHFCPRQYASRSKLLQHVRLKHPEKEHPDILTQAMSVIGENPMAVATTLDLTQLNQLMATGSVQVQLLMPDRTDKSPTWNVSAGLS